jgi:hypothetical protein
MDAPRTHIFVPCAVTIARAKRAAMCDHSSRYGDRDTVLSALGVVSRCRCSCRFHELR